MFGLDATEMLVLVIVGIVVVGPKKLPEMMRTAGQWLGKLRRMSSSLRSQSGIDEILRIEGLEKEMRELRALTRINVMDSLVSASERPLPSRKQLAAASSGGGSGPAGADAAAGPAAEGTAAPAKVGAVARTSPRTAAASVPKGTESVAKEGEGAAEAYPYPPPAETSVKPPGDAPPGAIPRAKPRAPVVMVALTGEEPLPAREWPSGGCDAYDALPDDLDEIEEAEAAAAAAAEASKDPTAATAASAEVT